MHLKIYFFVAIIARAFAFIHPITIRGRYFIDSETEELVSNLPRMHTRKSLTTKFYIKGVDYQPGGSSGVAEDADPLSDPAICARDIALFQDLGINVCSSTIYQNFYANARPSGSTQSIPISTTTSV